MSYYSGGLFGGGNVTLVASDRDCPRPDDGADSDAAAVIWDFGLSRASELWNLCISWL